MVSWCFQGVKKETGGMKWVKWCYIDFHKDCFKNNSKLEESKSAGMRVCISHMGQSIQEWTKKKLWKVAFKTFLNTFFPFSNTLSHMSLFLYFSISTFTVGNISQSHWSRKPHFGKQKDETTDFRAIFFYILHTYLDEILNPIDFSWELFLVLWNYVN